MQAIQKTFLASPTFAVVGASKDETKWGTKVLRWYIDRNLEVTPIHPKEAELQGVPAVTSVKELAKPNQTSISVITRPDITLGVLKQAKELSVPAVWIQPGAADDTTIAFIKENGMEDKVIYGGPCILVEGDGIRSSL